MKQRIAFIIAGLFIYVGGVTTGFLVHPDGFVQLAMTRIAGPDANAEEKKEDDEQADHIEISIEAKQNLGLRSKRIGLSDYVVARRVPGVIIEKPGFSDRHVSTSVRGIVTKVYVSQGQSVQPGDPLVDVQLTGENLVTAQSDLLATLERIKITDAELKRIAGLASKGGVAGKHQLELEYEGRRLAALRDVKQQELVVRGLTSPQIQQITKQRKLIRKMTLSVPQLDESNEMATDVMTLPNQMPAAYTIEELEVFVGKSIEAGDNLCHLADHSTLLIEGQAFEKDLDAIAQLAKRGWTASVEFGTEGAEYSRNGFSVVYVDNSVVEESQIFRFYLRLKNEVLQDNVDVSGSHYRSWRFKPGQRVHVRIPTQQLTDQLKVPIEAVVQEGPDAFVFRRMKAHKHVHEPGQPHQHAHGEEYERVPVHIAHQDPEHCVIDRSGDLKAGDRIAINNAYQLLLTMKSGSGGGHAHPHPH